MQKVLNFSTLKYVVMLILLMLLPSLSYAQSINIDMGTEGGVNPTAAGTIFKLVVVLTVLSIAPSILMMVTSFTRIIVVLSLLRSAIGLQQTPPNIVLISLALFLTFFIMQPVFEKSYNDGIAPLISNEISEQEALPKIAEPFRDFMLQHVRDDDLEMFIELSEQGDNKGEDASKEKITKADPKNVAYKALIPAFMISELRRAFEIGFLIFIPFLIIDMAVASVLMSMGMMMLPPVLISLPFKIIFFVLVDGWSALSESLVRSFS
ncbi:MAG TPA: flagellar biosynthetic protein FliP [Alphaproteobacteria bacterium]|nr:flagellar biosynthetic protein FliP [Alphaproteobacteria bacterium]